MFNFLDLQSSFRFLNSFKLTHLSGLFILITFNGFGQNCRSCVNYDFKRDAYKAICDDDATCNSVEELFEYEDIVWDNTEPLDGKIYFESEYIGELFVSDEDESAWSFGDFEYNDLRAGLSFVLNPSDFEDIFKYDEERKIAFYIYEYERGSPSGYGSYSYGFYIDKPRNSYEISVFPYNRAGSVDTWIQREEENFLEFKDLVTYDLSNITSQIGFQVVYNGVDFKLEILDDITNVQSYRDYPGKTQDKDYSYLSCTINGIDCFYRNADIRYAVVNLSDQGGVPYLNSNQIKKLKRKGDRVDWTLKSVEIESEKIFFYTDLARLQGCNEVWTSSLFVEKDLSEYFYEKGKDDFLELDFIGFEELYELSSCQMNAMSVETAINLEEYDIDNSAKKVKLKFNPILNQNKKYSELSFYAKFPEWPINFLVKLRLHYPENSNQCSPAPFVCPTKEQRVCLNYDIVNSIIYQKIDFSNEIDNTPQSNQYTWNISKYNPLTQDYDNLCYDCVEYDFPIESNITESYEELFLIEGVSGNEKIYYKHKYFFNINPILTLDQPIQIDCENKDLYSVGNVSEHTEYATTWEVIGANSSEKAKVDVQNKLFLKNMPWDENFFTLELYNELSQCSSVYDVSVEFDSFLSVNPQIEVSFDQQNNSYVFTCPSCGICSNCTYAWEVVITDQYQIERNYSNQGTGSPNFEIEAPVHASALKASLELSNGECGVISNLDKVNVKDIGSGCCD